MRTIRKKALAVCMAALLMIPGLAVSAGEAPEAETVNEAEIPAAVSGGDAAETVDAEDEAAVAETSTEDQVVVYADDDIASGGDGNITWVIDADGKLTVEGTGNLHGDFVNDLLADWWSHRDQITSAEINVTGMTDASGLFAHCSNLTSVDISGFDTSNVTDMRSMFIGCSSLTSLDVSGFDTSNVTDMGNMFSGCSNLTSLDVSGFDTSNVADMRYMFSGCSNLTSLDVSDFDTSNVRDMWYMFSDCSGLRTLHSPYNVNASVSLPSVPGTAWHLPDGTEVTELPQGLNYSVTLNRSGMEPLSEGVFGINGGLRWKWDDATKTITISGDDIPNVTITSYDAGDYWEWENDIFNEYVEYIRFENCTLRGNLTDFFAGLKNLKEIDVSGLTLVDIQSTLRMCGCCNSLTGIDLSGLDTSNVWNMEYMFVDCYSLTDLDVSHFNTSQVRNMFGMFAGCEQLTALDVSHFDTSQVGIMFRMFYNCSKLGSLDVSGFDTSQVTDLYGMFENCSSLTSLDVSHFDIGSATRTESMFSGCSGLTSLDVSGFDTRNVTSMWSMFSGCSGLTSLDVRDFDTSNVTDMGSMFSGCSSLKSLDVSGFDTSNVTNMWSMFAGCSSLTSLDVSGFDISNVRDMWYIFSNCSGLTTLHSPCNVNASVSLPSVPDTAWHLPDGTEVTELPQGLSYSVTLTRSDTPTTPQITTTTTDLNMENVVRVKYVPYSYTVETNNNDSENTVTFSIEEGRLADGLEIYPATGEIYGVPLETGEFKIRVKATYSNPAYPPAYAELTLIVLDNTDDNVGVATDPGYDITQPVADFDMGAVAGSGTQTLVSQGEYSQFRDVYIDGQKLTKGQDYTAEAGSTRITILNQTLANDGEGTHTLGVEFRTEDGTLKRAAQNYTISSGAENTPGDEGGDSKPSVEPPVNDGSNNNSGNGNNNNTNSSSDILPVAENPQQDFIVYTVERGDSLWKIATKFYGQGRSWRRIYEDNAAVIRNPGRLYAGQRLVIRLTDTIVAENALETSVSVSSTEALEGTTYKVQKGDRLWTIARRAYGNGRLWNIIYEANKDVIADPDRIREGQEINIPQR